MPAIEAGFVWAKKLNRIARCLFGSGLLNGSFYAVAGATSNGSATATEVFQITQTC